MEEADDLQGKLTKNVIKIPNGYAAVKLEVLKDDLLGETGTAERDIYEAELREDILVILSDMFER